MGPIHPFLLENRKESCSTAINCKPALHISCEKLVFLRKNVVYDYVSLTDIMTTFFLQWKVPLHSHCFAIFRNKLPVKNNNCKVCLATSKILIFVTIQHKVLVMQLKCIHKPRCDLFTSLFEYKKVAIVTVRQLSGKGKVFKFYGSASTSVHGHAGPHHTGPWPNSALLQWGPVPCTGPQPPPRHVQIYLG